MTARSKGHGRLFIRGGVWYMRWRSGGKECTRSTGLSADDPSSKAKAEAQLDEVTDVLRMKNRAARLEVVKSMLQSAEDDLRDRLAGIKRNAALGELKERFRDSAYRIDCSDSQLDAYCRYIDALVESQGGDMLIRDIDAGQAELFARSLAKGRSPNTYNKYLNGLALVWKAVSPSVGLTANPWESLPRKKLDTNVRRALTDEEIEKVFLKAKGEMRALFAIGLYTGLRLGDAVRLSWGDIRGDAVYVTTGKTGAKVAIPLHRRLKAVLEESEEKEGLVVPRLYQAYKASGSAVVSQRFARLLRSCGIETSEKRKDGGAARPLCGFHSLRHTFVSRCTAAGVPQNIVQALVGHTTARMTEHYTHLTDEAVLSAFGLMA